MWLTHDEVRSTKSHFYGHQASYPDLGLSHELCSCIVGAWHRGHILQEFQEGLEWEGEVCYLFPNRRNAADLFSAALCVKFIGEQFV
ncbi:hypothetical protein CJ177_34625 [Rhodococcus sp. ACPA1]|nr:hypothetical protein CJ177_34625 [Rhodococcus sp. ACPA1]